MSDASPLLIDEQNPWPGLREFPESAERFFNGRTGESVAVHRLVMQAPLTVLFGASGAGKSSLLQAGLFPLLRQEHCLPLYVRFRMTAPGTLLVDQANTALREQIRAQHVDAPEWPHGESLWEYLHRSDLELWSADNHLLTPVIVIDQFEEVFTLGADRAVAVARLKVDLADLIENRVPESLAARMQADDRTLEGLELNRQRYKVVLSFREDFLATVEGLKTAMPSIMRNRLRLLPMSAAQAFEAVHTTAPHLADAAMARRIVAFVAGGDRSPTGEALENDVTIEPALLSLVCAGLNSRRMEQGKPRFDADLLRGTGQAIVEEFYRENTRDMPPPVRRFIERELITEMGFRKPCSRDDAVRVHGVENRHLQLLVDRRLLRIEPIRGTDWVELMHDLLTPIVRADRDNQRIREERRRRNKVVSAVAGLIAVAVITSTLAIYAWFVRGLAVATATDAERLRSEAVLSASNLRDTLTRLQNASNTLAMEKAATDEANRKLSESQQAERAALHKANDLAEAESTAKRIAVDKAADADAARQLEKDARLQAEKLQLQAEKLQNVATASAATERASAELAQRATSEAERVRNLATAQDLASKARLLQRDEDLPLALQMAVHAYRLHTANCLTAGAPPVRCPPDAIDPNVHSALLATLNRVTGSSRNTFGAGGIVSATAGGTAMRLAGNALISARPGFRTIELEVAGWRDIGARTAPTPRPVSAPADRRVTAIALSSAGFPLVQAMVGSQRFEVWDKDRLNQSVDVMFNDPTLYEGSSHAGDFLALTLSRDGTLVAAANAAGVVSVWRDGHMTRSARIASVDRLPAVRSLTFAPDNRAVLIGTGRGVSVLDLVGEHRLLGVPATVAVDVRAMAFSPDGRWLAFGDKLGAIRVGSWDYSTTTMLSSATALRDTHLSPLNAVTFSPSGLLLASAGADGVIRVFRKGLPEQAAIAVLEGHHGGVESLVFADDGVLYSGGADRTIRIWPLRMDVLATLVCRNVSPNATLRPSAADTLRAALSVKDGAGDSASLDACAGLPVPPITDAPRGQGLPGAR